MISRVLRLSSGATLRSMLWLALTLGLLAGCIKEDAAAASIRGYSHNIEFPIYNFTVNGAMGSNLYRDGGGGTSCCVSLPREWRPGLAVQVDVEYDTDQGGPKPPPPRRFEVRVEPYTPENMGNLDVHFYPGGKVIAVSSRYSPGHPKYPKIEDIEPYRPAYIHYCRDFPRDPDCQNMPPAPSENKP